MPIDLSMLASKLRRYREQFRVTVTEMSAETGIPEGTLTSYESGSLEPTGDDILILADYFRCDYRFFVSGERVAPFEQTEILFRKHGDDFSKADRRVVQEFLFLCACEEFLLQELGHTRRPFQFTKTGTHFKTHGQAAAVALRAHLDYPANEVPMDVYRDFRSIGLHVFRRHLANSGISGLYIKDPVAGPCVLVNYDEDTYRQRFSVAHEAGHAILDSEEEVVVSHRNGKWGQGRRQEIRANAFASAYLMPSDLLSHIPDARVWDEHKATLWASKLKVSTTALAIALSSAGLVPASVATRLKAARVPADSKSDP